MKKLIISVVAVLLILAMAELFIYNYGLIVGTASGLEQLELDLSTAEKSGNAQRNPDGSITIKGKSTLTFNNITQKTRYAAIYSYGRAKIYEFAVSVKDSSNTTAFRESGTHRIISGADYNVIYFHPKGDLQALRFIFDDGCKGMEIDKIVLNMPKAFGFNTLRYLLCVGIALSIVVIIQKKLYKIVYNHKSNKQKIVLCLLLSCALVIGLNAIVSSQRLHIHEYPFDEVIGHSHYEQQFDAFLKGRLDLDIPFNRHMLDMLDNPYDYLERKEKLSNINYLWDRAYYDGKLYSYFGIAPIILVHYPVYLITGGVPNDIFVTSVFTLLAVIMFTLALLEAIKAFGIKPPFLLVLLGIAAICAGGQIMLLAMHPLVYYISLLSGMSFFAATITFALKAYNNSDKTRSTVYLALTGVMVVFLVWSRPSLALFCFVLTPYLWRLTIGRAELRKKLINLSAIAIPLLIGAIITMLYNTARFDSPLDFGNNYQLTLSDVSQNRLSLYLLPSAIYHYFLQPIIIKGRFPFFSQSESNLGVYQSFTYVYDSFGVLAIPSSWGIFATPYLTHGDKKKRFMYFSTIAVAIVIAFINICLAGIHMRYVCDIAFPVVFIGILALLEISARFYKLSDKAFNNAIAVISGIFVVTVLISIAFIFDNEADYIMKQNPKAFMFFAQLFE